MRRAAATLIAFHRVPKGGKDNDGLVHRTRQIEIPLGCGPFSIFEAAFQYGQNDFQPQRMPSVSVGDLITVEDAGETQTRMVLGCGFSRDMTVEEIAAYKKESLAESVSEDNAHGVPFWTVRQWGEKFEAEEG